MGLLCNHQLGSEAKVSRCTSRRQSEREWQWMDGSIFIYVHVHIRLSIHFERPFRKTVRCDKGDLLHRGFFAHVQLKQVYHIFDCSIQCQILPEKWLTFYAKRIEKLKMKEVDMRDVRDIRWFFWWGENLWKRMWAKPHTLLNPQRSLFGIFNSTIEAGRRCWNFQLIGI